MLPKVVSRSKTEGETTCLAINLPQFISHNKEMDGCHPDQIKDALKANSVFVGSFQNHFLQPGWCLPESETLSPVRIKRSGEMKNAKSLTCIYMKRSAFSTDELPVLDSCKLLCFYP